MSRTPRPPKLDTLASQRLAQLGIVLNAILAFTSLTEELERFLRSTGATSMRAFLKVRLPAALPQWAHGDLNFCPEGPSRRSSCKGNAL